MVSDPTTRWPELKLELGRKRFDELFADVEEFMASDAIGVVREQETEADGRIVVRDRLRLNRPIPVDRWSLAFGEGIHAYRTALDAFFYEVCTGDPNFTDDPRGVQYPVYYEEPKWQKFRVRLSTAPDWALNRIVMTQPFLNRGAASLVGALHWFDIEDKHHGAISLEMNADEMKPTVTMSPGGPVLLGWNIPAPIEFVDGAVLIEAVLSPGFFPGTGTGVGPTEVAVRLVAQRDGAVDDVALLASNLANEMPRTLRFLRTGLSWPR